MGATNSAPPTSFAHLEFVLDRYEVCYGPSSPVLVDLRGLGPRRSTGRVLMLADPRYPSESEPIVEARAEKSSLLAGVRAVPTPDQFTRLEKTRNEALAIGHLLVKGDEEAVALAQLGQQRSGSLSAQLFDLHLGAEASRRQVAGGLKDFAVLHFAAHGFVDHQLPERSGIALAFGQGEREQGYFAVNDVLALDLDANLVVLSACDTARDDFRRGQGIESMASAFLYAGARSVIASLWQVEDSAAAQTMETFYRKVLQDDLPPARALREAKLALRHATTLRSATPLAKGPGADQQLASSAHPFFWAPFIHIGLPR